MSSLAIFIILWLGVSAVGIYLVYKWKWPGSDR